MFQLMVTILIFVCALITHIFLHRFQKNQNKPTLKIIIIYPVLLLVVLLFLGLSQYMPHTGIDIVDIKMPLSSILMYCLFSFLSVILYGPYLLTGQVPAGTILGALSRKSSMSKQEILALFSEAELIEPRIKSLLSTGMINKSGHVYVVSRKGKMIYFLVHGVEVMLGIPIGG